uniref:Uncharacterized protein n=2 Tax=Phaeomonas parva TaxID=124430 RepID=A0A7S1XPY9_9STRA|mmetsp:Transcript_23159/g.72166  ORF Transcript_23159/g.72166 Transcript_23159/m.72166 type:complete len:1352 (+) Transcript_23159:615-4670(+)
MPTADNVSLVCRWLLAETGPNFLLWDLSDDADEHSKRVAIWSGLTGRVVRGRLQEEAGPHEVMLTQVLRNLAAMHSWLELDPANRCVVCCRNGRTRTGLMLACLLRYAGVFESSFDGLAHFYRRRAPDTYASMERAGVEIVDNEPATTRMLLSNFDVALSVGGPPNGTALRLDRVRITGMAALGAGDASLDLPSLELYTRGDAYRVTSGGRLEACVSLSADAGTVTIDVPNHVPILHEDFAVTSRVPRIGNAASGKRLLFRYANNKGFLAPGTITLDTEGVDVSRNLIKTLADDFTVELLLSEHDGSVKSFTPFAVESTPQHQRRRSSIRNSDFARMLEARAALDAMPADEERRSSAWSTTTTTSDEEDDGEYPPWQALRGGIDERLLGMQELQWRHIVQANQGNIDELAACGYDTTAAELALQLCANDTESAAATAQSIMAMNGVPLALTSPSPPERGRRSFMERGRRSFMGAPFSGGRGSTLSMEPARRERVSSFEPRSPGDASTPPPRDISSPAAGTLATGGRKKLSVPKTAPLARSGAARRDALASASNRASMQLLKTGTLPRGVSIAALSASPPKSADAARTEAIESMIAEVAQEDGVTLDEIRDLIMAKKAQKVVEGHKWPPDGPVLKRGLLMKKDRRKVLNRWQERDFVLTAAVLGYASHKENIKKGDKSERSVFALEELKEVSTSPTDGRVLMLRVGMESPITVRAPTAEDAQEWQYAIDSARGQAGERVFGRNPLMEGINSRNMRMHALSRLAGNDPASPISQASPVLSEGKSPGVANAGDPRQRDVVSPLHNLMPGTAVTNLSSKFEQQQQSPPPPPASPESEQGETTPQGSSYAVDPLASAASAGESANVAVPSLATASPKEDSRAALSALLTKHEDKPSPSSSESAFADEVKDHAGEGPTIKAEVKKFVMMLKAGVSRSAVEFKMQNDGMDVAELDDEAVVRFLEAALQPEEEPPQAASLDDLPPEHRRFVAMIKAGVPRPAVEHKMRADNVDPIFLDSEVVRKILGGMKKTAAADDDERYNKYKMMFKNGVPLGAVQSKMALDGLDPEALREWFASAAGDDKLDPSSTAGPGRRRIVKKKQDAAVATWKRRTLAWKEVKVDKDRETIWNEGSVNINLNDDELADFQALFKADPSKGGGAAADSSPDGEGGAPRKKPPRRVMANLIDPRRATNAGIAIKNLRIPHAEVREHILALNTRAFTAVQLSLLIEYWPTPDERTLLKGYRGDEESLNEAEVFMRGISDVCQGPARLRAMLFQSTFDEKLAGVTRDLESLEDACDDVRLSNRLRVLLRVVLQLGNKVNEDSAEAFTLDSLLKLSSAKSKDLKTSVLVGSTMPLNS